MKALGNRKNRDVDEVFFKEGDSLFIAVIDKGGECISSPPFS
jgi:hypothetical protein